MNANCIQWDPYNMNTFWNKKSVLIVRVSTFHEEAYISRMDGLLIGTVKSAHLLGVSTRVQLGSTIML